MGSRDRTSTTDPGLAPNESSQSVQHQQADAAEANQPPPVAREATAPPVTPGLNSAPQQVGNDDPAVVSHEDGEVDLLRFQAFSVSEEMRQELLEAKVPLATTEQLLDTRPPTTGRLRTDPQAATPVSGVNRNAPTQPDLSETSGVERSLRGGARSRAAGGRDSRAAEGYRASAPTLLTVRRRRLRRRRVVAGGMGLLCLGLALGVWRFMDTGVAGTSTASSADAPGERARRIAGNRPAAGRHLGPLPSQSSGRGLAPDSTPGPSQSANESTPLSQTQQQPELVPRARENAHKVVPARKQLKTRVVPSETSAPSSSPRASQKAGPSAPPSASAKTKDSGETEDQTSNRPFDPEQLIF